MFRALRRRAPLALAIVAANLVAFAATTATTARAGGGSAAYWGTPTPPSENAVGLLEAAACPASGVCLAVGTDSLNTNGQPQVAAESGGAWGASAFAVISGVTSEDAVYTSVACLSATTCVGVGYNNASAPSQETPFLDAITVLGSAVTPAVAITPSLSGLPSANSNEDALLDSVSCTASGCTAVGSYLTNGNVQAPFAATLADGSWSVAAVSAPAAATNGANLTAVSCPADGACEAVGDYDDGSHDEHSWAIQLAGGATPQTLPAPAGAVARTGTISDTPLLVAGSGGQQTRAISCPSAGTCIAAGEYPVSGGGLQAMAVGISDGAPGTPIVLPTESLFPQTSIDSIWCADAGDCAVVGDAVTGSAVFEPLTADETAGSWSPLALPPGSSPTATSEMALLGLGCTSVETCISAGVLLSTAGYAPLVDFSAPPLATTTSSLPAATVGVPYSTTLAASGGAGTSTWTVSGALPAGLTLNTETGVISGTPTTSGTDGFTVQLASAGPPAQTASVNLSIAVAAAPTSPAPPAAPAAAPTLSAGAARVTANGVSLPIGCAGSGTCSGTAVLTGVEHLTGKHPTAVTARAQHRHKVTIILARASYSLGAGQVGSVNLKLTAQARALLGRLHKISGRLTLTATGATAPLVTRTVTFRSAAKKRKRSSRG